MVIFLFQLLVGRLGKRNSSAESAEGGLWANALRALIYSYFDSFISYELTIFLGSPCSLVGIAGLFGSRATGALAHFGAFFLFTNPLDAQRMQTSRISQIPALTPLSLSHLCAKYLRDQFQTKLNARSTVASATPVTPPAQPLMLPVTLASELDMIAATLVDAFSHRSVYNRTYTLTC